MKLKLLRPVPEKYPISSPFGLRINPVTNENQFHRGIDFACPVKTEIRAMCPGEIFMAGWEDENNCLKGFGLRIWQEAIIEFKHVYLWYGHLNYILCEKYKHINEGDIIGLSGSTGSSSGPHLHVQARIKDTSDYFDMDFYDN